MTKISQADAARLKGVKRQRIHQLVKAGRLKLDRAGLLDAFAVLNLKEGKRGRPKLTDKERLARNPILRFPVNREVLWQHKPRDGYGFTIYIFGTIKKVGSKRAEIKFKNADGEEVNAWVKADFLFEVTANS